MTFSIKDLKQLLSSLNKKYINQVNMKTEAFELIINTKKLLKQQSTKSIHTIVAYQDSQTSIKNTKKIIKDTKIDHTNKEILNTTKDSNIYSIIISPMVGTFYRSPAPNEKAFIEQYDIVEKKQTVCIIEAMKLMNEIEAEVSGEIVEILVKDGDVVDCGQALMKVKSYN